MDGSACDLLPDQVQNPGCAVHTHRVVIELESFYKLHTEIKESHGLAHAMAVYNHATKAVECHCPSLPYKVSTEIKIAALLHDVDDKKYFPSNEESMHNDDGDHGNKNKYYPNALRILDASGIPNNSCIRIIEMIEVVSCSKNGNSVPNFVKDTNDFHLLIPRWCDRLEAVGAIGVIRCFQYNQENNNPISSRQSPRASTIPEVWNYATPERFEAYQKSGGQSQDMISHYFDKLLHVARPPPTIVRNSYLEEAAVASSKELVEMCIRFGKTGAVDTEYIAELVKVQKKV